MAEPDCVFVDVDNTILCSAYYDLSTALQEALNAGIVKFADVQPPVNISLLKSLCGPLDKVIPWDCIDVYVSRLRPNAASFLDEIRKMSPRVCALTCGHRDFQSEVLSVHGIRDRFDEVYGWDSVRGLDPDFVVPHHPRSILIDDQPPMCMLAVTKLSVMGAIDKAVMSTPPGPSILEEVVRKRYLQVKDFQGGPLDDHLMGVLPKLAAKIALL